MRQLLGEFIWWLMESVVCCLLRVSAFLILAKAFFTFLLTVNNNYPSQTSFYITEVASPKNRVVYFRHDVWEMITENKRMELMKSTYVEIPQV